MLKKREAIISALKGTSSRVVKKTTSGIRLPLTVNEAFKKYKNTGNNLWRYGIAKEINAVMISFELINEGENPPPTY